MCINNHPEVNDACKLFLAFIKKKKIIFHVHLLLLAEILRQQLPWSLRCLHLSFPHCWQRFWVNSYTEVKILVLINPPFHWSRWIYMVFYIMILIFLLINSTFSAKIWHECFDGIGNPLKILLTKRIIEISCLVYLLGF